MLIEQLLSTAVFLGLLAIAAKLGGRPLGRPSLLCAKETSFLFALSPLFYLAALYALSFRVQTLIGHWPQPYADDPKRTVQQWDAICRLLDSWISNGLPVLISCSLLALPLYALALRSSVRKRFLALLFVLFFGSCLIVLFEPGRRFDWWLD